MLRLRSNTVFIVVLLSTLLPTALWAQSAPALLNGTVTDPTGAVIPSAEVILTEINTAQIQRVTTGAQGLYAFPQVPPGAYELKVTAGGFKDYVQKGIRLNMNDKFKVDVRLEVGTAQQTVEVTANASPLNFENAEQKGGVAPETVGELPLMVSNGVRSAATFLTLLPGTSAPTGDALSAHLNGAVRYSGEALLNGGSLINPSGGQGMYSAAMDFAQSPDMVSELKVLQANYEPQYGSTGGAVIIMETKSGSNQFHGTAFEFLRNTALNARQFNADVRPRDIENDFGVSIGGPLKIPKVAWSNWHKTYFFFNWEGFRMAGAPTRDVMTIPSLKERAGDFSDWVDGNGNMIPVYDPLTSRTVNGQVVRDQFMGCDGQHPNVICPSRFQNSLALQWFKYLPQPTYPGPQYNYMPRGVGSNWNARMNLWNVRVDEYLGEKDHVSVAVFRRDLPTYTESKLPDAISTDDDVYKYTWVDRLNWDHIFSPTLLYHFSGGYDHDFLHQGGHNWTYADKLPQIPGAPSHGYPPKISFSDGFVDLGSGHGIPENNKWPAPAFLGNQLLTWVKGKHTWKFGFEYRNQRNSAQFSNGESGDFYFDSMLTGMRDQNSGNPLASFLLGGVSSGSLSYIPYGLWSARWGSWIAHAGDTWKVTPNLSLNLGIRWEMHEPSVEQHDVMSFFDAGGPNPGAGNLPGRMVFAGTRWGEFSYGKRYPEDLFKKGFSPRVGIAYTFDQETVIRTGYGIFYDAGYYPGWVSGIGTDGFNANGISFSGSNGGLDPAFLLSQGLPGNWQRPPFLDAAYLNGQWGPTYRPKDGNRLPYSQQWNFGIERQFTENTYVNIAYVGTKGTRLLSRVAPLNALNPSLLQQYGERLLDDFQPGDTSLDGVPVPYNGWIEQMSACSPSVAQALLPYPQYCGNLQGVNENAGNSSYHSLQVKFEKRFSKGLWSLVSYTWGKMLTDTESNQPDEMSWGGGANGGMISPFERRRNKAVATGDVPHSLTWSFVYDLPVGRGKAFNVQNRFVDYVIGGWRMSSIVRFNAGTAFGISNSNCNLPGQFRMGCIPGQIPGANPFAQDKGNFDPSKPLLNISAWEDANSFKFSDAGFYYGVGPRVTSLRGFGYRNQDLTMTKTFPIREKVSFQIRGDFFNVYNGHSFRGFDLDIASPSFGMWNGGVTAPRYIQVGGRVSF